MPDTFDFALRPAQVLRVLGPDRFDFIQRLGSGKLLPEAPSQTLFCNRDGKMVAWCTVWPGASELCLELAPAYATDGAAAARDALRRYLEQYIIMEDVHLEDPTEPMLSLTHQGPAIDEAPQTDLFVFASCRRGLLSASQGKALQARLTALGGRALKPDDLERRRILAGVPDPSREGPQPLELHLQHPALAAICWTKGCYVGQEVISRLTNFNKLARRLIGVRSQAPLPPADSAAQAAASCPDWRITDLQGAPLGRLTSWIDELGLGIVKKAAALPQDVLLVGAEQSLPAKLEIRPFFVAPSD